MVDQNIIPVIPRPLYAIHAIEGRSVHSSVYPNLEVLEVPQLSPGIPPAAICCPSTSRDTQVPHTHKCGGFLLAPQWPSRGRKVCPLWDRRWHGKKIPTSWGAAYCVATSCTAHFIRECPYTTLPRARGQLDMRHRASQKPLAAYRMVYAEIYRPPATFQYRRPLQLIMVGALAGGAPCRTKTLAPSLLLSERSESNQAHQPDGGLYIWKQWLTPTRGGGECWLSQEMISEPDSGTPSRSHSMRPPPTAMLAGPTVHPAPTDSSSGQSSPLGPASLLEPPFFPPVRDRRHICPRDNDSFLATAFVPWLTHP